MIVPDIRFAGYPVLDIGFSGYPVLIPYRKILSRISGGIGIKILLDKAPKLDLQVIINSYCNIQFVQIPLIRLLDKNQHDWARSKTMEIFWS